MKKAVYNFDCQDFVLKGKTVMLYICGRLSLDTIKDRQIFAVLGTYRDFVKTWCGRFLTLISITPESARLSDFSCDF